VTSADAAERPAVRRSCPRCAADVRYHACGRCRLRLDCPVCSQELPTPVAELARCAHCGAEVPQPAWPPLSAETPIAGVPAAPDVVEDLAQRWSGEAGPRVQVTLFATALVRAGSYPEAVEAFGVALAQAGAQPPAADLLLLRARAQQRAGDPQGAGRDLLAAVLADLDRLPQVAPWAHELLAETGPELAKAWAGAIVRPLAPEQTPEQRLADSLLRLHIAWLQADEAAVLEAAERARSIDPAAATARLAELADRHLLTAADGEGSLLLARALEVLGDTSRAIAAVETALELGFRDGADRGRASELYRDLLHQMGRAEDADRADRAAGEAYREAGWDRYMRDETGGAVELLELAVAIAPDDTRAKYYLAEALRYSSGGSEADRRQRLARAMELLTQARSADSEATREAWMSLTESFLYSDLADLDWAGAQPLLWSAALAAESSIALDATSGTAWAQLAKCHHRLENLTTARLAVDRALQQDSGTLFVLAEAAIVAVLSCAEDAATTVAAYQAACPENDDLLSELLAWSGSPAAAEPRLTAAAEAAADKDPTLPLRLARLRRELGRPAEATALLEGVWSTWSARELPPEINPLAVVMAGVVTGRAEALERLDALQQLVGRCEASVSDFAELRLRGCLALDRLDEAAAAGRLVEQAALCALAVRQLAEDLGALAARLEREPGRAAAATTVAEWRIRVDAVRERLQAAAVDAAAARSELLAVLNGQRRSEGAARDAALHAALARLWEQDGEKVAALDAAYAAARSPEGGEVGRRLVPVMACRLADDRFRHGEVAAAGELLAGALVICPDAWPGLRSELLARRAVALALMSGLPAARPALAEVLARYAEVGIDGVTGLADAWEAALSSPRLGWDVLAAADPVTEATLWSVLDELLARLLRLNAPVPPEAGWPLVTPILLEISRSLVPADPSPSGPMLAEQIPQLRERVKAATGIEVPGIRVRVADDLEPHGFRIEIEEGARRQLHPPPGGVFVAMPPAELPELDPPGWRPATDPVTGAPACWVAASAAEQLPPAVCWPDPLAYPFRELESVLIADISQFVTLDLVTWLARAHGSSGDVDLSRLTRVSREVTRRRTPLDIATLLGMAPRLADTEPADLVEAYRAALRDRLPGNEAGTRRLPVTGRLAAVAAGRTTSPAEVQDALTDLATVLDPLPGPVALVADTSAAADVVRGLLATRYPAVAVLSAAEVIDSVAVAAPVAADRPDPVTADADSVGTGRPA
jgi:hypothetical protein